MKQVQCPYCEQTFEAKDESTARTQEGIHRANEHINNTDAGETKSRGESIVDEWRKEGNKA